jgi:hypothetical protein
LIAQGYSPEYNSATTSIKIKLWKVQQ